MGNLIQTLGEKIKRGYEWLKEKAKSVVDRIQAWYDRYLQRLEKQRKHDKYKGEIERSVPVYKPEAVDVELSRKLAAALGALESGKLFEHLKSLPFEKRKEYIEKTLLPLICKEMNVTPSFIGWFQDKYTLGVYCEDQEGIALNEMYLATDNDRVLRMLINTIIHECKHAMQWDAVSGRNTHGYSQEQIDIWKRNFEDYISPDESDEGYFKQPVEWDARGFAGSVYPTDKN